MDFRNVNPLNIHSNYLSGNLLPLTPCGSQYSTAWKLYGILTWLIQIAQLCSLIAGILLTSQEEAFQGGTLINLVLIIEVLFIVRQIQSHRKLVDQLIQKLNDILQIKDDNMKYIVSTTLKPMNTPLKYYVVAGAVSLAVWFALGLLLIFEKDTFFYEDFKMVVALSKQPFSARTFILGTFLILISNVHIFLKKCNLYIYMIHFALMITAQYRYTGKKLAMIFREPYVEQCKNGQVSFEADQWANDAIKALCRHHTTIVRLSRMLRETLTSSLTLIYLNSIFRFCFTAIMFTTVLSYNPIEFCLFIIYSCGSVVEFYMLCSCMQQLQDASKNITDEAFHEKWYQFGPSVRRIFMLMVLGSNLGCKLSTCEKFNLSLPSFLSDSVTMKISYII
ncbi:uncharacterized protein LOC105184170 isoform X2 [Harpegnathos saltator]|uniref:uncharacterized protein LOC105184170 isoform X2 n=1 Tax=Harpegnathos saltator TaxID=610380 RepID=UPI000DBEDFB5|nr:uncharacterized protein LOC105184170 isoform X2 [Harpegnathos saltator]